jgi:hypothetical protein
MCAVTANEPACGNRLRYAGLAAELSFHAVLAIPERQQLSSAFNLAAEQSKMFGKQALGIALRQEKYKRIAAGDAIQFKRNDRLAFTYNRRVAEFAAPSDGFIGNSVPFKLLERPRLQDQCLRILGGLPSFVDDVDRYARSFELDGQC